MLKKYLLSFCFLGLLTTHVNAQKPVDISNRFAFDAFIGGPNLRAAFASTFGDLGEFNADSFYVDRVLPPTGLRFEYLLSDNFSMGLTGMYDFYFANYRAQGGVYSIQRMRLRTFIDFGIHLGDDEKIDHVLTFSLGPKLKHSQYYVNNQSSSEEAFSQFLDLGSENIIPLAARFNYLLRYYFSPNIGFHIGFGIGGPLFQTGLSFKFDGPTKPSFTE